MHKKETYFHDYKYCSKCKVGFYPLDMFLNIKNKNYSPDFMYAVGHFTAITNSFRDCQKVFKYGHLCDVSTTMIQKVANELGQVGISAEDELLANGSKEAKIIGEHKTNNIFAAMIDGGRCMTIEDKKKPSWKEVKVACFVDYNSILNDKGEKELSRNSTNYVGRIEENSSVFGERMYCEALSHGYANSKKKVFLSDGAIYNWKIQDEYFSDAIAILDWYHCIEHLANVAKIFFEDEVEKYFSWFEEEKKNIYNGKSDTTVNHIMEKSTEIKNSKIRKTIVNEAKYFIKNKERMNYKYFENEGLPIGSGVMEGGIKQLVNKRIKGTEKHWLVGNGNNILKIKIEEVSNNLHNLCQIEKLAA